MQRQETTKLSHIPKKEGFTISSFQSGFQQTCQRHEGVKLDYLYIDSIEQYVFKCEFCVIDENDMQYSLIPIEQVQNADQETILENYSFYDYDLINKLKYPIFEQLLPFTLKENSQQVPIIFTKTNYESSQKMGITKARTGIQLTCPANIVAQCVSQVLNKDVGYSMKLTFNRPYGESQKNGFIIALIQNSKIDSFLENSGNNWFYSQANFGGNMIIVKGERLSSENIRKVNQELEVRFCISKRQCFFSDSTYTNINKVREQCIDPNVDNRFGFLFNCVPERDWMVTIYDFKEIDPESVSQFN